MSLTIACYESIRSALRASLYAACWNRPKLSFNSYSKFWPVFQFSSIFCTSFCSTFFLFRSNGATFHRVPGQRDLLVCHHLQPAQQCNSVLQQQDDWEIWRCLVHPMLLFMACWLWEKLVINFVYILNISFIQARSFRHQKSLSQWWKEVEPERQQLWPGRGRAQLRTKPPSRTGPSLFLKTLLWSRARLNLSRLQCL